MDDDTILDAGYVKVELRLILYLDEDTLPLFESMFRMGADLGNRQQDLLHMGWLDYEETLDDATVYVMERTEQ